MADSLLQIGDVSDNGQVTIVDVDRLCYLVKSESRGAIGFRTISKALLDEYINYFSENPESNAIKAREALCGQTEIDKFEYGYTSTLTLMAKMALNKMPSKQKLRFVYKKAEKNILQQIFYGAPGTGKSNTIKKEVDDKHLPCIRTTFHPDSDYSTFVGAYKPTMTKENRYGLNGSTTIAMTYPDGNKKGSPVEDGKIEYRFVKQAFLKAYINAWKLFASSKQSVSNQGSGLVIKEGNQTFIIENVDEERVYYKKEEQITDFSGIKKCWNRIIGNDDPGSYTPRTDELYDYAACLWYKDKVGDYEHSAEECYQYIMDELDKGTVIEKQPIQQTYTFKKENGIIVACTYNKTVAINKINERFVSPVESSVGVHSIISRRLREYDEDIDKAWAKLKDDVLSNNSSNSLQFTPQFLIIEEINRGNCAQIFGDLFQLLDRKDGFSEYPIDADEDIRKGLLSEDTPDNPSFGEEGLQFSSDLKQFINSKYSGRDVADEIAHGKVLVLPPNLFIWATMNTSDQSLFPIDSAFKRRWDWKYIPIGYKNLNWTIEIGKKKYKWVDFQREINDRIFDIDNSEDKQLGDYFVNADLTANKISADTLLNKILFYIWNDVCKDDPDQIFRWKDDKDKNQEKSIKFSDFFCDENERDRKLQGFMSALNLNPIEDIEGTNETEETNETDETPIENDDDNDVTP